ncbi:methyl-accepting chemotaxis protein [Alteromonas sp. ASW11-130]|uniref:methyl-accepting chemotaxis protein n=1 Tax=Alteromonas sp. ASW11-130 TaxID=3015775 RepID=UPI002242834D|nr:methyl-accepting chemotaxis protein [Alteromonas sp. ASW11-130]MCW8093248.1 methyl-accepting chemotaxis protein [Alteromonas sp. ASW11-130]
MKLKTVLVASMASALLIPLIISTIFFAVNIRTLIDERLADRELPATLERLRNAIELELQESLIISKSIAENTFILEWMRNGEPQSELNAVSRYLRNVKQQNDAITAYIVSAQSGNYYNVDGVLKKVSPTAEDSEWLYTFLEKNIPYALSLDIDDTTKQSAVFINYAIQQNGRPIAVGGIGRSLVKMTKLIEGFKIGETGQIYLVNKSGETMLHRDAKKIGQQLSSIIDDSQVASDLTRSDTLIIESFERSGEDYVVASLQLNSLDWYLVAELPKAELYSDLNAALISNLIIILIIAAAFLVAVGIITKRILEPIGDVSQAIDDISQRGGDLTARLPETGPEELAELSTRLNTFISKLQSMCLDMRAAAWDIDSASSSVNKLMESAAEKTNQQQAGTEMVASAVNEMGATVQEIAGSANMAAELSREAERESESGLHIVEKTVHDITTLSAAMDQAVTSVASLADKIKSITTVLEVIKGISEQTNLLALNAAIEAARAGEQGRGFAVVADEVRTLAQRTAHSTEEINEMIAKLEKSANETVSSIQSGRELTRSSVTNVEETGTTISTMSEKISAISQTNISVAAATEEQSTVTDEINKNINEIAEFSHSTQRDIHKCEDKCSQLKLQVERLNKSIGQFTLE